MRWMMTLLAAMALTLGAAATAQSDDQLSRQYSDARYALGVRDDAAVLRILDAGFPLDYTDGDGYTLLHQAASNNRVDMVKELLRRGADPAAKSRMGFTPVDSGLTYPKIVDLLVAAGGPAPTGYRAMKPPVPAAAPVAKASAPRPAATRSAADSSPYAKQCQQKWYADQALCSDSTCKMRTYRKWQTCLKTGSYY